MNGPKTLVVFVAGAMEPYAAMSEAGADERLRWHVGNSIWQNGF